MSRSLDRLTTSFLHLPSLSIFFKLLSSPLPPPPPPLRFSILFKSRRGISDFAFAFVISNGEGQREIATGTAMSKLSEPLGERLVLVLVLVLRAPIINRGQGAGLTTLVYNTFEAYFRTTKELPTASAITYAFATTRGRIKFHKSGHLLLFPVSMEDGLSLSLLPPSPLRWLCAGWALPLGESLDSIEIHLTLRRRFDSRRAAREKKRTRWIEGGGWYGGGASGRMKRD